MTGDRFFLEKKETRHDQREKKIRNYWHLVSKIIVFQFFFFLPLTFDIEKKSTPGNNVFTVTLQTDRHQYFVSLSKKMSEV